MSELCSNFIIFGNASGWFGKLFYDIKDDSNCNIGSDNYVPWRCNRMVHIICVILMNSKISKLRVCKLMSKGLMIYFVNKIKHTYPENSICLFNRSNAFAHNEYFIKLLKKKCSSFKLVYWYTDIVSAVEKNIPNTVDYCKEYFDLIATYDEDDARKYKFCLIETPYSYKYYKKIFPVRNDIDLLYIGKAKLDTDQQRFEKIIKIYEKAIAANLHVDFTIVDVPEELQKYKEGIKYNTFLNYDDVVRKVMESKCLLEVSQEAAKGNTLRVMESVSFDKYLLFTNKDLINNPYFLKDRMIYLDINNLDDFDFNFIESPISPAESTRKKFSPLIFLNKLHAQLNV